MEADAVDLTPDGRLLVRLAGRAGPLAARVRRLRGLVDLPAQPAPEDVWTAARELSWAPDDAALVRVGLTHGDVAGLDGALDGAPRWLSIGANVAWVAWPPDRPIAALDAALAGLGRTGMVLRGADARLLGARPGGAFAARVRDALDPDRRFGEG